MPQNWFGVLCLSSMLLSPFVGTIVIGLMLWRARRDPSFRGSFREFRSGAIVGLVMLYLAVGVMAASGLVDELKSMTSPWRYRAAFRTMLKDYQLPENLGEYNGAPYIDGPVVVIEQEVFSDGPRKPSISTMTQDLIENDFPIANSPEEVQTLIWFQSIGSKKVVGYRDFGMVERPIIRLEYTYKATIVNVAENWIVAERYYPTREAAVEDFLLVKRVTDCDTTPPAQLSVGIMGYVTRDDSVFLRIGAPTEWSTLPQGAAVKVQDGPVCAAGSWWWEIETSDGLSSWVPESDWVTTSESSYPEWVDLIVPLSADEG